MTKPQHMGRLLRVSEAAIRLGLQQSTIRRMISERKIDVVRPTGRAVRISEGTIDDILLKGYRPAVQA